MRLINDGGIDMIEKISRANDELDELLELVNDFKSEISTNAIWNMNPGFNAPSGIETSGIKWKKFVNRSMRTLKFMLDAKMSATTELQRKIGNLSMKRIITSEEIEDLEFEFDNLLLGLKNLNYAYEEDNKNETTMVVTPNSSELIKSKKVFISHSSGDRKYVKNICELLEDIGLGQDQIFCSSIPGYDIPVGQNIYDYLRSEFIDNDLTVLFILSENYYNSVPCLNEMGAAWVLKTNHISILLPGFNFHDVKGAIDPRDIAISIDDEDLSFRLNDFKDSLIEMLDLSDIKNSIWERYRQNFINNVTA